LNVMCNIHFVFLEFYIWHLSPPNALDYPQSVINIWGFIFFKFPKRSKVLYE
jgi:hypothetical protein